MRTIIAETLGWTIEDSDNDKMWHHNGIASEDAPPLYCDDLNAMDDAYKYLVSISKGGSSRRQPDIRFRLHLMQICNPDKKLWDNGTFLGEHFDALKTANATVEQRAKAFIHVIGKWEDDGLNKG